MKLQLPNVSLICLTNQKFPEHLEAMEKSSEGITFGARKIVFDMDCDSISKWNYKIIYDLPKYIDTTHALLVHADGYVLDASKWKEEWLELDYIGSPWPLPTDNYSYRDELGEIQRVGNSVSLRSKKLMDLVATREWKSYYGNTNEDGFISCHNRKWLESQGCKFGTFEQALDFGREHDLPEHKGRKTFLFHAI